jgi:hypothetical protein
MACGQALIRSDRSPQEALARAARATSDGLLRAGARSNPGWTGLPPMVNCPVRIRITATALGALAAIGGSGCADPGTCGLVASADGGDDGAELLDGGFDDGGFNDGGLNDGGFNDGGFNVPPGAATTVSLSGCAGPGYAAEFTIGSRPFQLEIDTGSGTLAVASSACASCGIAPGYTPGPGAVDQHKTASEVYLQGSWSGEIESDSVQLVGVGGAMPMKIAAIDTQTAFFDHAGCGLGTVPFAPQGIVGFGPADLAIAGTDAFITELTSGGAVGAIFAVELCSQGGQLMIGGVDAARGALSGAAVYTPMTTSQYYAVQLDDLQLSGASLTYGAADFGTTVVDTGTSVLALPPAIFRTLTTQIEGTSAFTAAFGGQKGWLGTTTCFKSSLSRAELDAQLPTLTLVFPGVDTETSALVLTATESYLPVTLSGGTDYYCSGLLENDGTTGTILGTSAMLGHLAIFDLVQKRFGFAPQTYCP